MVYDLDELQDDPEALAKLLGRPTQAPPSPMGTPNTGPDAAPPAAPPKGPDFDPQKYMVTPEELADARDKKRTIAAIGGVGQALANRRSFGDAFLKQAPAHVDVMGGAKMAADNVDQGIADKRALQKQEMEKPEMEYMKQAIDKSSDVSQISAKVHGANLRMLGQFSPDLRSSIEGVVAQLPSLSAYQQNQLLDKTGLSKVLGSEAMGMARVEAMRAARESGNSKAAQKTVNGDKIINTYVPRIDGAQKILGLMDAAEGGDVKSNQALLGQLNAEISRLETGSQSPGLHASEKTEMNDARAKFAAIRDTLSGGVTAVNLHDKFQQARGMVKELGSSYYSQLDNRMNFLKAGALPDQMPGFEAKQRQLLVPYQTAFSRSEAGSGVPGVASAGAAGKPAGVPKIGYREAGFEYVGGEPGKPESWKKVQ